MNYAALLIAAAVPTTVTWSPKVAVVMAICNVLAIAIGYKTIQNPKEGPAMPAPQFFGGFGLPAVTACFCLGHIIGVGAILGLANIGVL